MAQRQLYAYYEKIAKEIDKKIDPERVDRLIQRTLKRKNKVEFEDAISQDSYHSDRSMHQLKPGIAFSEISDDQATEESDCEATKMKRAELDRLKQMKQQLYKE